MLKKQPIKARFSLSISCLPAEKNAAWAGKVYSAASCNSCY